MKKNKTNGVMKLSIAHAVALYRILDGAKLSELAVVDRFKVIGVLRQLRPVAREWAEYVADVKRRLAPANEAELRELQQRGDSLTADERARLDDAMTAWQQRVNECLSAGVLDERDVAIEPIGEAAVCALLESNPDWEASVVDLVDSILNISDDGNTAE